MPNTILTTAGSPWSPDVNVFAPAEVIPTALIVQVTNSAGKIEGDAPSVRVAYFEPAEAGFVPEGDDIDEASPDLAEVVIYTGKIAQLLRISREQYVQQGTSNQLASGVQRALIDAADKAFLSQVAPVAPAVNPPEGILSQAIVTGSIADDLDGLVDIVAAIQANGGDPSHVVVDPLGWAAIRKLKIDTDSNASLIGAGVSDAIPQLVGIPILVNAQMPAKTGLVIDQQDVISALGSVEVATSEHMYFGSDSIGLRATFRFGAKPIHPERLGKFTVA